MMNLKEFSQMEVDILKCVQTSINKSVQEALTKYNSPLSRLVDSVIESKSDILKNILEKSFENTLNSEDFKESCQNAFNHKVAKVLVNKLEGSIEKCVTTLRSDPTIRARMILAIENIIKDAQ
jgi:negative regulator of replication initiation